MIGKANHFNGKLLKPLPNQNWSLIGIQFSSLKLDPCLIGSNFLSDFELDNPVQFVSTNHPKLKIENAKLQKN